VKFKVSHALLSVDYSDSPNVTRQNTLSCNQVFHLFCFPYSADWSSVFHLYALFAGSLDRRTARCVGTAATPGVSLRLAKTTPTTAETATEGIARKACTRLVLLPVTN
jgi:hypothetical protein